MVEHLLDSLRRYKVICDFSGQDFDAEKTVQYSKLRKEMVKKEMKVLVQLKLPSTQVLIHRFRRARTMGEKSN